MADTYIADLVLRFLNSLQLRRVCDHAETFPFILLKILPVENLQDKHDCVRNKQEVKTWQGKKTQKHVAHHSWDGSHSQMNSFNAIVWVNKEMLTNEAQIIV